MTDVTDPGQSPDSGNPPATPPAGTPPAAAPATETPFYSSFEDTSVKEWAEGKGWKSAEAVTKSAMHLEKMVGAPADKVVRIPVEGDTEGWTSLHRQLGAPETAEAYEMPGVGDDDLSQSMASHMKKAYLAAGLTQDQVNTIVNAGNEFITQTQEQQSEDYKLAVQQDDQELRKEWGQGYDTQIAIARNAAQRLEFTEDAIDALEGGIGHAATMKLMAKLGEKLGEDRFVQGDGGGSSSTYTPAQAKSAWDDFKSDPNNMAALMDRTHPGHAQALAKKKAIFEIMHPTQVVEG